jgi:hypothetical protein
MNLCAPTIIYIIFSLTQIVIDAFNGMYNTALMKIIVMIMVSFLLQILCDTGLNIISWIIVFIPFILMTVIVSILLYVFGLNASTGTLNYSCDDNGDNVTIDSSGNVIVYDPYYNPFVSPVYYSYPNIIVPKPPSSSSQTTQTTQTTQPTQPTQTTQQPIFYGSASSSPAYQN